MKVKRSVKASEAMRGWQKCEDLKNNLFKLAMTYWNTVAILPLLLSLASGTSRADILSFTYHSPDLGSLLSGTMNGTFEPDDNTFVVTSMGPLDLDGAPAPALPFVDSPDNFLSIGPALPTVTLNASFMDLFACTDDTCSDGFLFGVGDGVSGLFGGVPVYSGGPSFGNATSLFDANGWSAVGDDDDTSPGDGELAPVFAATPEPSSLWLGLTAVALALAVRRHRRLGRPISG